MTVNHSSRGRLVLQSLFHRPFQCGRSRKLRLIVTACCWTLAAGPSAAAIYDPGPLVFETFGQSMWDSGNAAILSDSAFLGTSWDASIGPLGGIIGEERERVPGTGGSLTAPNPLHAVWRKCRDSIFKSVCGSEPSRTITVNNPIPAQFVDTRSGATLSAGTNGRVGLDLSYALDSGSVDAGLTFDTTLQIPDEITVGEHFYFNPSSKLVGEQSLNTTFPEVSASIDAVFEAAVDFQGQACAALFGCQSGSGGFGVDETFEVVSFNDPVSSPGQIKILGEADPAVFQFGSKIEIGGPLTNVGNVTVHVPDLDTEGQLDTDGRMLSASGESAFIDFRADLDGLASLALGLPTLLGASADIGPISIGYDIVDVEAGPDLKIVQTFDLVPTLMVDLQFDSFVDVAGVGLVDSYSGAWDTLPGIALPANVDSLTVTPTFHVDAVLHNRTGFGVSGVFTVDALTANASATVGPATIDIASFGPLYQFDANTTTLSLPPIFDNQFGLGGFNSFVGQPLTIGTQGVRLAGTLEEDYAAILTTGSPVSLSQLVDTPGNLFTLEFDYLFQTGGGWLDILLGGFSLLSSPLTGPGFAQTDFSHFSMTFDLAALGISFADPQVFLEFLYNDDTAGSILLVDSIVFPSLLNGDFQTGGTDNWRPSQTGEVGVLLSQSMGSASSVPEPASLLLLGAGLVGLGAMRSRRRHRN